MFTALSRVAIAALLTVSAVVQSAAYEPVWTYYRDPVYGFSVDLPLGLFEPLEQEAAPGTTFLEVGGSGQLSIYGGRAEGLTLDQFAQRLSEGDQIRAITYRVGGDSWFVLSGNLAPDGPAEEPLIFYTKLLLSADGRRFSAFELSYPEAEKSRYDAIVERIEDTMTRPPPLD
jgi:hypothetical protein